MTSKAFHYEAWIERLAGTLSALARAHEPYLQAYQQHHPRERLFVNGRDETAFPLDDLRMVYAMANHSRPLAGTAHYASLREVLDPARHALRSHPRPERVAVIGRPVGDNDFWLPVPGSGTSVSAEDLLAGLMARAAELHRNGFRAAAGELNAFLAPVTDRKAASALGNLDKGCDMLLFWGLNVAERIDIDDNTAILPHSEVRRFLERQIVEELAPPNAGFHEFRSVGAVVRTFRWRPVLRRRGSVNEPMVAPTEPFEPEARTLLDLRAINHAVPVVPLGTMSDCIDTSAARLLDRENHNSEMDQQWPAHAFNGFAACAVLRPEALRKAMEVFSNRQSTRYRRLAT